MSAIPFGVSSQAAHFWTVLVGPGPRLCLHKKTILKSSFGFLPKQNPRQELGDQEFNCDLTPGDWNKGGGGRRQGRKKCQGRYTLDWASSSQSAENSLRKPVECTRKLSLYRTVHRDVCPLPSPLIRWLKVDLRPVNTSQWPWKTPTDCHSNR